MAETARFFLFHGPDGFTQRETLAGLKSRLGDASVVDLNTTHFDGRAVRLGELMQVCDSFPFLSDKRLVVVEGLLERLTSKDAQADREALLAYLPKLLPSTRLVFLERSKLARNNPFLLLAAESPFGYVRFFEVPRGIALEMWIKQRVEKAGGTIRPQATALLATNVGENLWLQQMEINKLLDYVSSARPIEPADVELLTPYAAQAGIFELVDAIGQRNGKVAVSLLQDKLAAGEEPLYLFAMIVRQVRLLIQVKEKAEQGVTQAEMAQVLGQHRFVIGKVYQQAYNFALSQLEEMHKMLLDTDMAIKTGQVSDSTALQLLVVELIS